MQKLKKQKIIPKPWGREEILEENKSYVMKLLFIDKGHALSLQYHEVKLETIFLSSGMIKLSHGESTQTLETEVFKPGDYITISPNTIHRMEALEDSVCVEASTPELDDVIRLEDRYKRI
jgi:mannose-6-phosphate isomerase